MQNVKVSLVTSVRFAKSLQEEKLFRHRGTQFKRASQKALNAETFAPVGIMNVNSFVSELPV